MSKLNRVTGKIFASNADPADIGQYGSALAGNKTLTGDISQIQALPAFEEGWRGAVISQNNYPTLQEMNGLQKVFSQQIAYNLQRGIPEWDNGTDYYIDCFCSYNGRIYKSLIDNNISITPGTDSAAWEEYNSLPVMNFANQDLSNLTIFGNARLQYMPFSINAGTVTSGENTTLNTNSGSVYRKRNILKNGDLGENNGIIDGFNGGSVSNAIRAYSPEVFNFKNYKELEFQIEFTTGANIATTQSVTGGTNYSGGEDPFTIRIQSSSIRVYINDRAKLIAQLNGISTNTTYTVNIKYSNSVWVVTINGQQFAAQSYNISNFDDDYINLGTEYAVSSSFFNKFLGSINLSNTYLIATTTSDTAVSWYGVIDSTSSDYDWIESAGSILICDPCIVTSADMTTVQINNQRQYDISSLNNGTYIVLINIIDGSLELIDKSDFIIAKTNSNNKTYWLDISTCPANFKISGNVNNNYVAIGECAISSGTVGNPYNYQFNMNGFFELSNLPDYNSAGVSISNGSTFTAEYNGWILNGNAVIQPIYVGCSYTASSSGYRFVFMKGY